MDRIRFRTESDDELLCKTALKVLILQRSLAFCWLVVWPMASQRLCFTHLEMFVLTEAWQYLSATSGKA